ncbi:MMPL family transporter [Millisia brevis]|uniref:MMPL family transporter n=1 Tax=Millisia brevis TaxID=264148 RepID=UPI00082EBAF8|nr:MMPL family transporter [Millisia brevis]
MAQLLAGLGRFSFRRRGAVLLVWLLVLAGSVGAVMNAPAAPPDDFSMPGTESQQTFELLEQRFPELPAEAGGATVVFVAPDGQTVTSEPMRAAIEATVADLATGDQVAMVADPFESDAVSADSSAAYASVMFDVPAASVTADSRTGLESAVEIARDAGLTVDMGGDALESGGPTGVAELVAISLAAVILLVTLGSVVAAGLPLVTALIGVAISMLSLMAVSSTFGLSTTTTTLALMLGLAVGIDYALFVLARYREERGRGIGAIDAAALAVGTAGSAVTFAGVTVVIALAGLVVVGMPMLTKMGLAAAAAVIVAVLVALTLVPAVIGFVPDKVLSRADRRRSRSREVSEGESTSETGEGVVQPADASADPKPTLSQRWARLVMRRPVAVLAIAVALLAALALPATGLRLGMPGDEARPTSETQRRAYDALAEAFGPGFNGPLMIVVDAADAPDPQAAVATIAERVAATAGIVSVSPPMINQAGNTALFDAVPSTAPTDEATKDLVNSLRNDRSEITAGTGATFTLTGTTAINIDLSAKIQGALVAYLATVVGLAVLLLLVVFRSILVPIKAALGFLLSVLAALGSVVLVFQNGVGAGILGVQQTGPIQSAVPIFMIGVVFGLAMDYQVFLVSRKREAYVHGRAPHEAIEDGMQRSSRVIVAAALIMIAVFAGFVVEVDPFIKMLGFSLAIAVFFDAFVVRLAIVPAVMALLGRHAWYLPSWLDRLLPDVDIEGTKLQHRHAPEIEAPVTSGASTHGG